MASRTVPCSLPARSQGCPHPAQGAPRRTLQLTRTDLQNRVAEAGEEGHALLLTLALVRLCQLYDQRAFRADVRNDKGTDLAVGAEAMGTQ